MSEPTTIHAFVVGLKNAYVFPAGKLKDASFFLDLEEARKFLDMSPWAKDLIVYKVTIVPVRRA
jgi:hypothetical protein